MSSPPVAAGRTYLVLDGRAVAQVVAFSASCDPGLVEEFGLDEDEPYEVSPTVRRTQGTLGLIRRLGDGGADGMGFTAGGGEELLSRKKYSSMALVDVGSKAEVFSFEGSILFGNETWQMVAKGTMSGAVSFRAKSRWTSQA